MSKIIKIEEVENVEYVYDPVCDYPHAYVANGFVNHNCILWIDEIEKGISGSKSSGLTDGGTTSRVVSTFLTWMQEKTAPVFVVCTANDVTQIPPEFMRAGRFDEIFFVDLPTLEERREIFGVLIRRKKRDKKNFNLSALALNSENYSGAEIEKSIDVAMFEAFDDNQRDITTDDILKALKTFQPLAVMRKEEFDDMKKWASGRCVMASAAIPTSIINNDQTEKNLTIE